MIVAARRVVWLYCDAGDNCVGENANIDGLEASGGGVVLCSLMSPEELTVFELARERGRLSTETLFLRKVCEFFRRATALYPETCVHRVNIWSKMQRIEQSAPKRPWTLRKLNGFGTSTWYSSNRQSLARGGLADLEQLRRHVGRYPSAPLRLCLRRFFRRLPELMIKTVGKILYKFRIKTVDHNMKFVDTSINDTYLTPKNTSTYTIVNYQDMSNTRTSSL